MIAVMITVREMIEMLSALPSDLPVLTRGYEGDYDNANEPKIVKCSLNSNADPDHPDEKAAWYYGRHKDEGTDKAVLV